ncbi:MAG TPA: hypothetical protein VES20_08640 [Bryobacteraceae bacterium]|nr:hypothetical protein [Bryobacteraceae bacterium]
MHACLMLLGLALGGSWTEDSRWQWRARLPGGQTLEIRAVTGDIRAVPSTTGEVEIEASVAGGDPGKVTMQVLSAARGFAVSAAGASDTRVSWAVKLPPGVGLVARTVNGEIRATQVASDVDASTVNGSVAISTSGTAMARTVNGSINASLLEPFWTSTPEFTAVNGGITLRIPSEAKTSIRAETRNGKLTSQLPDFRGTRTERSIEGAVGGVGSSAPIVVRTLNGPVDIRM